MNRLVFVILAVFAAALGLLVGTLNSNPVSLDLLWVKLDWPLGLVLLLALATGLVAGLLIAWFTQVLPLRLKLRKVKTDAAHADSRDVTRIDD